MSLRGSSLLVSASIAFASLLFTPDVAKLQAQEPANSAAPLGFHGRVLDSTGEPVTGAKVLIMAEGTSPDSALSVVSDAEGRFNLNLPAGDYQASVVVDGFAKTAYHFTLTSGEAAHDFKLSLDTIQDTITVRGSGDYLVPAIRSGTKTDTPLRDVPQSVTVITRQLMQDQLMTSIGDVVRYVPGVTLHQGENNRDQVIIRGNSSSADFFVDGIRDDVQYYRDIYNLDRVEALKGSNAMVFGRGGGGGVINRVTKEAEFGSVRELDVQGGSYDNRRVTADFEQAVTSQVALRVNGLFEDSGSFRDGVDLKRSGIAPALTFQPSDATKVTLNYEHFRDERTADRGITSFRGKPAGVDADTFYGNSNDSHVDATVDLSSLGIEHRVSGLTIRNKTLFGAYDRFYQNYVPGAANATATLVTVTAYNNATKRENLFNQTDFLYKVETGTVRHSLLAGVEVGRQTTDNFRNTGFFNNTATSILLPFNDPSTNVPVTFRQSATDADNHLRTNVSSIYVQDQLEISPRLQVVAGLRFERFDLEYHNNRNGDDLDRADNLVSPRAGIIFHPIASLSLYGNYSVSYLPSSGDQFSSLTTITKQVEPEEFNNYEVGAKWDASDRLFVTASIYRLNRTNTRATDPNDPTRIVQTGSQRTNGYEIGANGKVTSIWSIAGGYAHQDAFVTSATTAARKGATVGQVPKHTISLWNNVQVSSRLGAALGLIYRSEMFATIDNSVTLPGYTRVDAAVYYSLTSFLRLQLNVENLLDHDYYANADSNTNISPGSPRAARVGLTAKF